MSLALVNRKAALLAPWNKNELWRRARAVPSLDLRFADNKSLVDATSGQNLISFTRASSGTYVDSQGVIRTATTNLLLRSEEFDNASWSKPGLLAFGSGSTANAIAAPNGSTAADLLTEDTSTGQHRAYQTVSGTVNANAYTLSVYVKAKERTRFYVGIVDSPGFSRQGNAIFNLSNGTVVSASAGLNGATGGVASIQDVGNGWYRCSYALVLGGTNTAIFCDLNIVSAGSTISYTGDGTSGIYLWGAQLEQSSTVGEYIPTTSTINSAPRFDHNPTTGESLGLLVEESRTNLALNSATFQPTSGGAPAAYTVDQVAPDGTTTGSRQTAANPRTFVEYTGIANALYTFSFYCRVTSGTAGFSIQLKNAATDTVIASDTSPVATTAWRRFTISGTTTGATTGARLELTGVVPGFVFWGAQLEAGAFPTSYIPTTTATATRSADVASISGSNFGVSRTNLLLRSEEFNNASWSKFQATVAADTTTSPTGSIAADSLLESAVAGTHVAFQDITTSASSTYTLSVYVKANQRSRFQLFVSDTGVNAISGVFNLSAGTVISATNAGTGSGANASITPFANGWYRCALSGVPASAGATVRVHFYLLDNASSQSYTGDGTSGLYIWGAQLETGTTATAYIPTTSAAVTVVDSPWYRQDEGTMFAEGAVAQPATGGNQFFFRSSDSSYNNTTALNVQAAGFASLSTAAGGVFDGIASSTVALSAGVTAKFAGAYAANNLGLSLNGATAATDTTATVPMIHTRADIGSDHAGVNRVKAGTIRRLTYWPQRLSNSTLQSITQ